MQPNPAGVPRQLAFFGVTVDGSAMIPDFPVRERLAVIAAVMVLFLSGAMLSAVHKDVTRGFDELAQASYVAQSQHRGAPLDLGALRMLEPHGFRFTAEPNYLNHPPLYYVALGSVLPQLEGHPGALIAFRLANVLLAAAGLAASLMLGLRRELGRLEFYAYLVSLVAIPVLVSLAGAVNNDNAAFCGGAIALLGLFRLLEKRRTEWLAVALIGFVVAAWAKLTGLLLCGTLLAAGFGYLVYRRRLPASWGAAAIVAAVLAALPYAYFVARYGSVAPETAAQHAMLAAGARIEGWAAAPRLSLPAYVLFFSRQFLAGWLPSLAPRDAFHFAMLVIPAIAILVAAVGVGVSVRRLASRAEQPSDVLVLACAAAFAVTFVCHLWFSYRRHLDTGWMMDAYPRYYLPIAPFVPLAGLSAVAAAARRRGVRRRSPSSSRGRSFSVSSARRYRARGCRMPAFASAASMSALSWRAASRSALPPDASPARPFAMPRP